MDPGSIVLAALTAAAVTGPVSASTASTTRPVPVGAQRLDGPPQRVFDDDLEGDDGAALTSDSSSLSALLADRAQARNGDNDTDTDNGTGSRSRGTGGDAAEARSGRRVADDDGDLRVGQLGGASSGTSNATFEELAEQLSAASETSLSAQRLEDALEDAGLNDSGTGRTDTEQPGDNGELTGRGGQDEQELLASRSAGDDLDDLRQPSQDDLVEQSDQQDLSDVASTADTLAERRASGARGGGVATGSSDDDAAVEQIAEDLHAAVAGSDTPSARRLEAALEDAGFGGAAAAQIDTETTGRRGQNDVVERAQGSRSSRAGLAERLQQQRSLDELADPSDQPESPAAAPSRSVRASAGSTDADELARLLSGAGQRSRDQGDLDRRRSITSALERSSSARSGNGPQR